MADIKGVGEVRKFNKSFYVLVPYKLARELKIEEKTPWQLKQDGETFVYTFKVDKKK